MRLLIKRYRKVRNNTIYHIFTSITFQYNIHSYIRYTQIGASERDKDTK